MREERGFINFQLPSHPRGWRLFARTGPGRLAVMLSMLAHRGGVSGGGGRRRRVAVAATAGGQHQQCCKITRVKRSY